MQYHVSRRSSPNQCWLEVGKPKAEVQMALISVSVAQVVAGFETLLVYLDGESPEVCLYVWFLHVYTINANLSHKRQENTLLETRLLVGENQTVQVVTSLWVKLWSNIWQGPGFSTPHSHQEASCETKIFTSCRCCRFEKGSSK